MALTTALITGAAGQDGRLLSRLLLDAGCTVIGLVRRESLTADQALLPDVQCLAVDLCDPATVRALLEKWQPEHLYHLAASHHASQDASVGASLSSKEGMVSMNFGSSKTLAFALLETRLPCHLVFASSSQMYTAGEQDLEVCESTLRRPLTLYGHTKSWSVDLLSFLRRESGLRASSAILFNHESPLRTRQFVSRKVTLAAAAARMGCDAAPLELNDIGARVDWCSARDVVHALHSMADCSDAADYVIGSGQLRSVRDLLQTAFGHVGLDWREHTAFREDRATPTLRAQPQALQQRFGWRPRVSFESMIAEMVEHDLTSGAVSF